MISETTKQRIEQEAKEWETSYYTHLTQHSHKGPSFHFIAGATAYAERVEELERENAQLKRWKEEAMPLLNKILDWGQLQMDIRLGKNVIDEAVERLQEHKELKEKNAKMVDALESVGNDLGVICDVYPTLAAAKTALNTITNALQQWRGENK